MKIINRTIALILCLATLLSVCSCVDTQTGSNGGSGTPDINVSVVDGDKGEKEDALSQTAEEQADIYSMVCHAVEIDLNTSGFDFGYGVLFDENQTLSIPGIYYFSDYTELYDNEQFRSCGFYYVVEEDAPRLEIDENISFFVQDYKNIETAISKDDETINIYTYDFEDISAYHFVYQNKYITYYLQEGCRIVYSTEENVKDNYDLSLGSIYNYDSNSFIYDESIFGEYTPHSGIELFGQEDYEKLEANLQQLSDQQLKNGYVVNEFNIVYISPEAIQAYLLSDEEDTFFGYSVDDLSLAFGAGTALTYTENGFSEAQILPDSDYNWKSFLIKCGVGCGIILVGAILTPVTGGASFGCALITITKFAVGSAIAEGLGTLAIETVVGLIQGQTIEEAIKGASYKGLDAFANGFMIGAAIGSVGVVSGLIKPSACFVAGTPIAISANAYTPIELVRVGDYVCSYNEVTGISSLQRVSDVFCKEVYQTISLTINGEIIETTLNHPFYSPKYNQWVAAGSLNEGDLVYCLDGTIQAINHVAVNDYDAPVKVYNFTVENNHTYFVGNSNILVHNTCEIISKHEKQNWRNQAGREAKERALPDIINDKNYHGITDPDAIDYIKKTGRMPSYKKGDPFQIDYAHPPGNEVNDIMAKFNSGAITKSQAKEMMSDSTNGLLCTRDDHIFKIHGGDPHNPSSTKAFVKLRKSAQNLLNAALAA